MADKHFTLLSVHLHDAPKFVANAPGSGLLRGDEDEEETPAEDDETESGTCRGKAGMKVLVGLLLVVGLAFAAKKLMGGDDLEGLEELDELEE